MTETLFQDKLINIIPQTFGKVLVINFFEEHLIQHLKQNKELSLVGISTEETQSISCEQEFNFIHYLKMGKNELPYENKYFNFIIGKNIFTECFSLPKTISELNRVLSPDGILMCIEPNVQFYPYFINLLEGNWDETLGEDKPKLHFFTQESLSILLSNSSFHVLAKAPIEIASSESFIIGPDKFVHTGRYHIGPLSNDEYKMFLCKKFLILASKLK